MRGIAIPVQQSQGDKWLTVPVILILVSLVIAIGSVALTIETEMRWIGHAVTATIALVLMIVVILTGAVQKGRLKGISIHNVFRFHRMVSVVFSAFVIGTFLLGLLTTLEHGEPVLQSPHGIIGLLVVILTLFQLVPSLMIARRSLIRLPHTIIGYIIVPLFVLQIILGLQESNLLIIFPE